MKKFTFYWLDGKKDIFEGDSPSDAFARAGYGGGALRVVDFYVENEDNSYVYNKEKRSWDKNKLLA